MYLTLQIVFTFSLTSIVIAQKNLISPCPRLFQYENDNKEPDRWYGTLTMMTDYDTYGNFAQIYLDKPAIQLGNWYGVVYTVDNMIYSIAHEDDQLKANNTRLVRFFVRYDPAEPPPKLVAYNFNTKRVCPEEGIIEATTQPLPLQTSIILDFKPNPSKVETTSQATRPTEATTEQASEEGEEDETFFMGDLFNLFNPPSQGDTEEKNINEICGTSVLPARPLITHGQPTREGEFPWHVALYHTQGVDDWVYICGASLVSKKFVISVAHCVTAPRSSKPLKPRNLKVYLGKHFLKSFSNEGIQERQLSEIKVHPQYNGYNYSNDIALLKLQRPVEYTDFVRPICLWEGSSDLNSIVDKQGKVVGWGFDESGKVTDQLVQADMPVVSVATCLYSFPLFFSRFTTVNTFCAGLKNGTSVCNGDSGGGMVFPKSAPNAKKTVWQLRGLVSISAASQNNYRCDASHFVIYTDTAKYLKWIKSNIFK